MITLFLKCTECGSETEVKCDGDNAMYCPECLSVDTFEDIEE